MTLTWSNRINMVNYVQRSLVQIQWHIIVMTFQCLHLFTKQTIEWEC